MSKEIKQKSTFARGSPIATRSRTKTNLQHTRCIAHTIQNQLKKVIKDDSNEENLNVYGDILNNDSDSRQEIKLNNFKTTSRCSDQLKFYILCFKIIVS